MNKFRLFAKYDHTIRTKQIPHVTDHTIALNYEWTKRAHLIIVIFNYICMYIVH